MLAIRTGRRFSASSLLPIVVRHCKDRNACGSVGGGGGANARRYLQVTRKRELGPWTHTPKCAELYFKQEEDPDGEAAAPHVCFTQTHATTLAPVWLNSWSLLITAHQGMESIIGIVTITYVMSASSISQSLLITHNNYFWNGSSFFSVIFFICPSNPSR